MNIVCLDLEGVLVPEIWIAFSQASGIPELRRTTRDEPDYNKLMNWRIGILHECQHDRGQFRVFDRFPVGSFRVFVNRGPDRLSLPQMIGLREKLQDHGVNGIDQRLTGAGAADLRAFLFKEGGQSTCKRLVVNRLVRGESR